MLVEARAQRLSAYPHLKARRPASIARYRPRLRSRRPSSRLLLGLALINQQSSGILNNVVPVSISITNIIYSYEVSFTPGHLGMKETLCRCRSHCTRYDPTADTYVGPGIFIPYKTARRHALEDQRAEALGNFAGRVPPPASNPPLSPSNAGTPDIGELSQEELSTLEAEATGRAAWTPADYPLVFLKNPGHLQEFILPEPSEVHLSNYGPHALEPTHYANTAFIENEMRLCEILVRLRELEGSGVPLGYLEEKVWEGLTRMWKHKEAEWRRSRYRSVAIHHGFSVVDTGAPLFWDGWHGSEGV